MKSKEFFFFKIVFGSKDLLAEVFKVIFLYLRWHEKCEMISIWIGNRTKSAKIMDCISVNKKGRVCTMSYEVWKNFILDKGHWRWNGALFAWQHRNDWTRSALAVKMKTVARFCWVSNPSPDSHPCSQTSSLGLCKRPSFQSGIITSLSRVLEMPSFHLVKLKVFLGLSFWLFRWNYFLCYWGKC